MNFSANELAKMVDACQNLEILNADFQGKKASQFC